MMNCATDEMPLTFSLGLREGDVIIMFIFFFSFYLFSLRSCSSICSGVKRIFCNFAETSLEVNGHTFRSSEELFQLMKFKDAAVLKNIVAGITANDKESDAIKMTAKSIASLVKRKNQLSLC